MLHDTYYFASSEASIYYSVGCIINVGICITSELNGIREQKMTYPLHC